MTLLQNKRAIVTGGSRGIGRAISLELARQGADVIVNYYSKSDDAQSRDGAADEVVAEIRAMGRRAMALEGNIGDEAVSQLLVAAAVEQFGGVDILASNAGISPFHTFLDLPADLLRSVVEVNLVGAFLITQAVARRMKEQGAGGAIVATSSIAALVGAPLQTHYAPTKAGVHSLMQSAAVVLGAFGIRCNSVMPGAIATDLNRAAWSDPEVRSVVERRVPLGRWGTPEDVANVVAFLASDKASYVTGTAVLVDGGAFVRNEGAGPQDPVQSS